MIGVGGSAHCAWCHPPAGATGLCKKTGCKGHREQASKQSSYFSSGLWVSALISHGDELVPRTVSWNTPCPSKLAFGQCLSQPQRADWDANLQPISAISLFYFSLCSSPTLVCKLNLARPGHTPVIVALGSRGRRLQCSRSA